MSAAIKITPQVRVQWPLWYGTKDKDRGRRDREDRISYDDLSISADDKKDLDFLPGSLQYEAGNQ